MPRRMRDPSNTTSPSLSREPRKEPTSRSCTPAHAPRPQSGEPATGLFPTDNPADGWSWSGPTGLPLQLLRVIPDPRLPKPEAGPDQSNVSACLQHALLTEVCKTHPMGFGVQKESISISLFQCGDSSGFLPLKKKKKKEGKSSFTASGPRDRRHSRFSSTVYEPHTGHSQVLHSPYHPEQGCQRLSFVVKDVTSPRPSRQPNTGIYSASQHFASSIAFLSRMGASTRGIALGSLHSSLRLHT